MSKNILAGIIFYFVIVNTIWANTRGAIEVEHLNIVPSFAYKIGSGDRIRVMRASVGWTWHESLYCDWGVGLGNVADEDSFSERVVLVDVNSGLQVSKPKTQSSGIWGMVFFTEWGIEFPLRAIKSRVDMALGINDFSGWVRGIGCGGCPSDEFIPLKGGTYAKIRVALPYGFSISLGKVLSDSHLEDDTISIGFSGSTDFGE